jgi:hypothetical protein
LPPIPQEKLRIFVNLALEAQFLISSCSLYDIIKCPDYHQNAPLILPPISYATQVLTFIIFASPAMATIMEREGSASSSSTTGARARQPQAKTVEAKESGLEQNGTSASDPEGQVVPTTERDAFGNEDGAEIHYKTCKWYVTSSPSSCLHI